MTFSVPVFFGAFVVFQFQKQVLRSVDGVDWKCTFLQRTCNLFLCFDANSPKSVLQIEEIIQEAEDATMNLQNLVISKL